MIRQVPPEKIMRFVYLDEAGIANPKQEPYTVVAGVMMHIDGQYGPLQKYLLDMADDVVGKDRPKDFYFHAKDIWHGKKFFNRDDWPDLKKRLRILEHILDIPEKFNFQVIYACVERAKHIPKNLPAGAEGRAKWAKHTHTICMMSCLHQTELLMREHFSDERVFLVAEDHETHKGILRQSAILLGDPRNRSALEDNPGIDWEPATHLVDEPLFAPKSGASPLQVADACAFVLSRHYAGCPHVAPFIERIKPQMPSGLLSKFVRLKKD